MDHPLSYADILKQTVQAATVNQPDSRRSSSILSVIWILVIFSFWLQAGIISGGWIPSCFMPV